MSRLLRIIVFIIIVLLLIFFGFRYSHIMFPNNQKTTDTVEESKPTATAVISMDQADAKNEKKDEIEKTEKPDNKEDEAKPNEKTTTDDQDKTEKKANIDADNSDTK